MERILTINRTLLAASFLAATLTVRADGVCAYAAPKDPTAAVNEIKARRPVHWATPKGWTELEPTVIRVGNFRVPGANGKAAEVAITTFPGKVGTELANVNRWRSELGLGPIAQDAIASQAVQVGGLDGKLYDLAGAETATVVVSVPRAGNTWFIKLRGDKETAQAARAAFIDFLKTITFD